MHTQMNAPCILFIDEIDSITQKRETASKDMERRIVAQMLTCMDELNSKYIMYVYIKCFVCVYVLLY